MVASALAVAGLPPIGWSWRSPRAVLLQDNEQTLAMLHQLRALGVRIAMDDFGTGYSSLSYLRAFPFDKIKIDRSFVHDITGSVSSLNIVRAVAALANGLCMASTAEGVETQGQLDTVKSEGCTEMQGFYLAGRGRSTRSSNCSCQSAKRGRTRRARPDPFAYGGLGRRRTLTLRPHRSIAYPAIADQNAAAPSQLAVNFQEAVRSVRGGNADVGRRQRFAGG